MKKRPNIVYLMTDQQKASATSVYGNPFVPCPFMDRMAGQGLTFRDVYAPASICTPSRASVMTGVHPLVHQVTCHQNRAPHNLVQLPEILSRSGYYTAVVGHYEYDRELSRGWHHQTNMWTRGPIGRAAEFFYSQGGLGSGWASGSLDCTAEEGHAHTVATRVIHQLESIQASGAPFFLHVPFLEPHPPFYTPPPYDTLVDPATLPLPERGDDANRPRWQEACRREQASDLATEEDIRKLIAIYYGMIAYANNQMQRIHDALDQRGMLENTWIIVASDHGDFLGEKGLFAKAEALYECLLHVPLIVVPPPGLGLEGGQQIAGLVDLIDLFPTILEIAGIEVPEYAQGKDLISWVTTGASKPLRDCVFSQVGDYHGHLGQSNYGGTNAGRHPGLVQASRSRSHSYIRDPDYGDEAYDLRRDPLELNNLLSGDAPEEESIRQLRARLEEWERECLELRSRLGVVPGYRGFDEGWE